VALLLISLLLPAPLLTAFGLIWLAHLGLDRMLGFGLKYPPFFKDTPATRLMGLCGAAASRGCSSAGQPVQ
jgi:hypothetical protein